MQVPLVVVDPNTDVIVSSNRAAETIGVRAGQRFADLVWPDERARAHYQQMQVGARRAAPRLRRAGRRPQRAGRLVERYAIVRSVAVTAPIDALAADERHRLGVLFLLDPEADVALLADESSDARAPRRAAAARRPAVARRRHAGARARSLSESAGRRRRARTSSPRGSPSTSNGESPSPPGCSIIGTPSPPPPHDSVVDRDQLEATLARFARILRTSRDDRELRARLHWDNGTLAAPRAGRPGARRRRRLAAAVRVHLSGARRLRLVPRRGDRQRRPPRRAGHGAARSR